MLLIICLHIQNIFVTRKWRKVSDTPRTSIDKHKYSIVFIVSSL